MSRTASLLLAPTVVRWPLAMMGSGRSPRSAGLLILLLIIVADGVQQQLLFFPTGVTGLAGHQLARA